MTLKLQANNRSLLVSLLSLVVLAFTSMSAQAKCEYPFYEKRCIAENLRFHEMKNWGDLEWTKIVTQDTAARVTRIANNVKAAGNKSQKELWEEVTFEQFCFKTESNDASFNGKSVTYLVRVLEGFEEKEDYLRCDKFYANKDGTACYSGLCENGFRFKEEPAKPATWDSNYEASYHIPDDLEYTRGN